MEEYLLKNFAKLLYKEFTVESVLREGCKAIMPYGKDYSGETTGSIPVYSSRLTLNVCPVDPNDSIATLIFEGEANVRHGDHVLVQIPLDKTLYRRHSLEEEKAIEIIRLLDSVAVETYRSNDYNSFFSDCEIDKGCFDRL